MAVSTVDEYLSALEKSKLLDSQQFVEAQRLAGESSDAAALARALARENLVSRWQAGTLLALGQRAQLRLGKYKLIQRLGKGGMGTVFLAQHVTMNRRVALKVVPRSIAENPAALDRFFAEARAIAALDHPNIVQAYSIDNEMDRYFIVMEFVDGQDLQQMVDLNGPLGFEHAADYVRQAAEGLAHAHARNLVHCDIKPSNLLVNNQGVIKILDLGLARLNRNDQPRGSAAGEPAFGTVDYMAPEQALETANFDHRADIYSLGCTLYCLLTGHPPFPEGTLAQRIVKHQTQEPCDILLERPDAPPLMVEICKRMMAKEPENRYQSMHEVSAALAPWQNSPDGAQGGRAPLAVTPLDDAILASPPADDWLSSLAAPLTSSATSNGAKASPSTITKAQSTESAKQHGIKNQTSGGVAAALAGVLNFGRAKLGWFHTTQRKIVGALGGILLLAVVAGLASLPFLLSRSGPPPQTALQPTPVEKKPPSLEVALASPPDKASLTPGKAAGKKPDALKGAPQEPAEKKPDASKVSSEKKSPEPKVEAVQQPKHPLKKKRKGLPSKSAELASKSGISPGQGDDKSAFKRNIEPAATAKTRFFSGLAAAVDLPQPGKGANPPVSLGNLDHDAKSTVDVRLLGGDIVAKGNPKFELQKDGDAATPAWSLRMAEKNKDAVKIARLWQEQDEWKIQWAAGTNDKATLLRYCGLQFSRGNETQLVALSTPKPVQPLLINVNTGATRLPLNRGFALPDPSAMRLQILTLDESMPKHQIEIQDPLGHGGQPARGKPVEPRSGDTVPVRGRAVVVFTTDKPPGARFVIGLDGHGRDLQLNMQAFCWIAGHKEPYSLRRLQEFKAEIDATLMTKDPKEGSPKKKTRNAPTEQDPLLDTTKTQLKALSDLAAELSQKASIPFRVYALLGKADDEATPKLVIFQSAPLEDTKPDGANKN